MGFLKDLAAGAKAEGILQAILAKHGLPNEPNADRNNRFDIKATFPARPVTFEAKFDLYCARSGNIAIEFFNPKQGKPSGINATEADIWVHMITKPMSVWFTPVPLLKEFTLTQKPFKLVSCGGDDNSSMYLYKKDVIFDAIFTRVDECTTDEFMSIMNKLLRS